MNYTELINSRFAKENIKIYTNYCMCLAFSWIIAFVAWLGVWWIFATLPDRSEDLRRQSGDGSVIDEHA